METNNNMKRSGKKRGLSPVIASVLMILLVIVLASIIFLWARGFISEQIEKFGQPVGDLCESVDFMVERVGDDLEILNRGPVNIRHLDIKMFKGGDSEIKKFDFSIDAGAAIKKEATLVMGDGSSPDKIIVYPALIGNVRGRSSNKVFTCTDAGVTL